MGSAGAFLTGFLDPVTQRVKEDHARELAAKQTQADVYLDSLKSGKWAPLDDDTPDIADKKRQQAQYAWEQWQKLSGAGKETKPLLAQVGTLLDRFHTHPNPKGAVPAPVLPPVAQASAAGDLSTPETAPPVSYEQGAPVQRLGGIPPPNLPPVANATPPAGVSPPQQAPMAPGRISPPALSPIDIIQGVNPIQAQGVKNKQALDLYTAEIDQDIRKGEAVARASADGKSEVEALKGQQKAELEAHKAESAQKIADAKAEGAKALAAQKAESDKAMEALKAQHALEKQELVNRGKPAASKAPAAGTAVDSTIMAKAANDPQFDIDATTYLTEGAPKAFAGFARGKEGQAKRDLIVARANQIMKDLGLTASDIPALKAQYRGNVGALAKLTSMGASVSQFERTLGKNMDIARTLSDAYSRNDTQFLNRIQNAFNTGTGDTEALNLSAQLHGVSREWAKIMSGATGAAGIGVTEAKDMDQLISKAMSNGQINSLFDKVIIPDARARKAAIEETKASLVSGIKGLTKPVAGKGPLQGPAKYNIGDTVNYLGKPHKISAIAPNGKLTLEP